MFVRHLSIGKGIITQTSHIYFFLFQGVPDTDHWTRSPITPWIAVKDSRYFNCFSWYCWDRKSFIFIYKSLKKQWRQNYSSGVVVRSFTWWATCWWASPYDRFIIISDVSFTLIFFLSWVRSSELIIKQLVTSCSYVFLFQQHYATFLNCLRAKEFKGALDSLYHYFDQQQWHRESAIKIASSSEGTEPERCHRFRYAALNLAALHCQFGHRYVDWGIM